MLFTSAAIAASTILPLDAFAQDALPLGSSRRPVVVIGAGGKTGKLIVTSLLAKGGYGVRACTRGDITTDKLGSAEYPADDVDLRTGVDVTKPETLKEAVEGAGAVIFAASASQKGGNAAIVDCVGVENIAKACIDAKVERLVIVSSCAVTRPDSLGYKFTNIIGNIMDYKAQGEERTRALYKGVDPKVSSYTIVRPGGLKDAKEGFSLQNVLLTQGDVVAGDIERGDVAEVAIASIFDPNTINSTFECFSKKGKLSKLQKELNEEGVSGKHTTSKAYEYTNVIKGQESVADIFTGLKKDTEYDANNGYKGKKQA